MTSSAPWWGSALIALAGSAFGIIVTSTLTVLNRRTERRRLTRADKMKAYPAVHAAAGRLARTPVWPADTDPGPLLDDLRDLCTETAFFSTPRVNRAIATLLGAAEQLHDDIAKIRRETAPGHGDTIDRRVNDQHQRTAAEFETAIEDFVTAARHDLEIRGPFTSLDTTRKSTTPRPHSE